MNENGSRGQTDWATAPAIKVEGLVVVDFVFATVIIMRVCWFATARGWLDRSGAAAAGVRRGDAVEQN